MFEKALPMGKLTICPQNDETQTEIQPMVLSVKDLQTALGLSRKTVYDLVKTPGFPSFHVGGRILINKAALQRWMDEQTGNDQAAA